MKGLPSDPSVFYLGMCIGKGAVTASGLTSGLPPLEWSAGNLIPKDFTSKTVRNQRFYLFVWLMF